MKKKVLAIVLVLLILCGICRLTVPAVRNIFIDSMNAEITKTDDCYYTDEDIESAIETVKEFYKAKEWPVVLMRIRFSDDESRKKLMGYHLAETTDKENIITLFCDYIVLDSFAAYSRGIYTGWSAILVRENNTSKWEYADGGYA